MEQFNYCLVAGQTDVGKKRAVNEDNMDNAITQNGLVSVVCDGMGGHVGGATASRIAVETILENLKNKYYEDPRIAIGESIDIANRAILKEASARPELSGMGSTCVLLIVRDGKVYIGHVGDSRIYLIRSKRIIQLTKDHSYVQMLVDRGEITKEQAEHHPRKNEITNALGIPNMTPATIAEDAFIPEAGDCFLLCSDGLSGMVSDAVINKVVSRQSEMSAQARLDRLISIANDNGGLDNITAQMVEFTITPGTVKPGKRIPLWLKIMIPAVALILIGLGAYLMLTRKNNIKGNSGNEDSPSLYSATDTTDVKMRDVIVFKPNAELVTIVFGKTSVIFKHDGKQISSEINTTFNPDSLKVNSSDIDIVLRGENRVLKFTNKYPGKNVIIELKSSDSGQVNRFIIPVSEKDNSGLIRISGENKPAPEEVAEKDPAPVVKCDTVRIELGEYTLAEGEKIIFNYVVPYMKLSKGDDIKGIDEKLGSIKLDEVKNDEVVFDKNLWSKEFKPKLLTFTYKGKHDSPVKCEFIIPCFVKDTTDELVLIITMNVAGTKGADKGHLVDEQPGPADSISQSTEMYPV